MVVAHYQCAPSPAGSGLLDHALLDHGAPLAAIRADPRDLDLADAVQVVELNELVHQHNMLSTRESDKSKTSTNFFQKKRMASPPKLKLNHKHTHTHT